MTKTLKAYQISLGFPTGSNSSISGAKMKNETHKYNIPELLLSKFNEVLKQFDLYANYKNQDIMTSAEISKMIKYSNVRVNRKINYQKS